MKHALIAIAALLAAAQPAAADVSEPAGIAPGLRASAGEVPDFALRAEGAHVYECRALDGGGFGWVFLNPDATLYEGARSVGTHATPGLWESSTDRSSTTGLLRATQPAGPANLPWALYRTQPSVGSGMFAGVTSVQRVNTSGGVAPAGGCGANTINTETRASFTADYYFYKRRG